MKKFHPLFIGIILITLFGTFGTFAACSKAKDSSNHTGDTTSLKPYTLVWQDNFDEASLDTSTWNYEVNGNGGGNNELQYYTNLTENCSVKDGYLVIQALKKDYNGKSYTSARINTDKKGDWLLRKRLLLNVKIDTINHAKQRNIQQKSGYYHCCRGRHGRPAFRV